MANAFDDFDAPAAPNAFDEFDAAPAAKPKGRTIGQTVKDLGVGVAQGSANLAGSIAQIPNLVTGGALDRYVVKPAQAALDRSLGGTGDAPGLAGGIQRINEGLDSAKSDVLRQKQRELSETKGVLPTIGKVISSPTLLGQFAAEQVPVLATLGLGTAGTAARATAAATGRGAAPTVAAAAGRKAAERGIVGASAGMGGGFAGQATLLDAAQTSDSVWDANPEFRELAAAVGRDEAKQRLSMSAAQKAAAISAPISALAGRLTAPLEAGVFTRAGVPTGLRGFGGAVGKEGAEEAIQEGGEQFSQNVGIASDVDPTRSLGEGVPESAAVGGTLGSIFGGGLYGAGRLTAQPGAAPEKPSGPLVRAALAAPVITPAAPDPNAEADAQRASMAADDAAVRREEDRASEEERRQRFIDAANMEVGEADSDITLQRGKNETPIEDDRMPIDGIEVEDGGEAITLETDPLDGIEVEEIDPERVTLDSTAADPGAPRKGSTKVGRAEPSELSPHERAVYDEMVERRAADGPVAGQTFKTAPAARAALRKQPNSIELEVKRLDDGQFVLARKRNAEAEKPAAEVAASGDGRPGSDASRGDAGSPVDGNRPDDGAVRGDAGASGRTDVAPVPVAGAEPQPAPALTEKADEVSSTPAASEQGPVPPAEHGSERPADAGQSQGAAPASRPQAIRGSDGAPYPTARAANVARAALTDKADYNVTKLPEGGFELRRVQKNQPITPPADANPPDVPPAQATPLAEGQAAEAEPDPDTLRAPAAPEAQAATNPAGQASTTPAVDAAPASADGETYLPDGWGEGADGIATNRDPERGGIVDREIKSGKWFAVPEKDGVGTLEGFDTRKEAFEALERATAPNAPASTSDAPAGSVRDSESENAPAEAVHKTKLAAGAARAKAGQKDTHDVVPVDDGFAVRAKAPEWSAFEKDSGTLGIARADMPQVKAEHRGALVQFLKGRGIEHASEEVDAKTLKATQAEFSPAKVAKAKAFEGGDRSIIVSSDNHVVDGHHQWLAKRDAGEPIKVIRLNKTIAKLLPVVKEFPSAESSAGTESAAPVSARPKKPRLAEDGETLRSKIEALGDDIITPNGRAPVAVRVIPGGTFQLRSGAWQKLVSNGVATKPATKAEVADIEDAMSKEQVEVVALTRPGYGSGQGPQSVVQVLHSPSARFRPPPPSGDARAPATADIAAAESADAAKGSSTTSPKAKKDAVPQIQDFGEKLPGARKDYATKLKDAESLDIAKEPLSKTWPEPDYESLIESGADAKLVGFVRAARDEIPARPVKSWKLRGWVEEVRALREFSAKSLSGEYGAGEAMLKRAREFSPLTAKVVGRAELYEAVGHGQSLKGITFEQRRYTLYKGQKFDPPKELWSIEKKAKASAWSSWPTELAVSESKQLAIEAFKARVQAPAASTKKQTRFDLYSRNVAGEKRYFIGRRNGSRAFDLKSFESLKEARAYLAENRPALEQQWAMERQEPDVRAASNAPRVGADHRKGGDVKDTQFAETFGFRGVQFGNYVEQKRRQEDLNNAYDGLMDLAGVLGIPPRSLSLNGKLGLAFGARGRGGRNAGAAHYEPGHVVINLTKESGAGSLAHEWWHALDNYFSKMRGEGGGYVTEKPRRLSGRAPDGSVSFDARVRPEMIEAFGGVMAGINVTRMRERSKKLDDLRSKAYWTTDREMSARAFESYIINKLGAAGVSNDYLANVLSEGAFSREGSFPYPTAGEIDAVRAGFDGFFSAIQHREENGNTVLFRLEPSSDKNGMSRGQVQSVVDALAARWANAPRIVVLESMADPRAPKTARDAYARLVANGATGTPRGFITRDGVVYVVASQNPDRAAIVRTVLHEAAGHYGLRGVFGANLQSVLQQVVALRRKDVQQKMSEYGFAAGEELRAAEEVLAEMAETNPQLGFVRRAIAAIRTFARTLGLDLELTDDEIINSFILPARRYVQQGAERAPMADAVPVAAALSKDGWVESATRRMSRLVDEWSAKRVKPSDSILLGNTPPVLRAVGIPDLQVDVTGALLVKTQEGRHKEEGITPEQLKMLPRQLYDPLAVFESDTSRDAFVIVTELRTRLGDPVIAALHVGRNAGRLIVNRIASVYGKEDAAAKFAEWAGKGRLRYLRNEESLGPSTTNPRSVVGEVVQAARSSGVQFKVRSDVPQLASEPEFSLSSPADAAENSASFDAPAPSWLDNLVYSLQDKQIDLRRIQQAIAKAGKTIADSIDPYLQEELFYGRAAKQTQDFLDAELKPLLKDMAARGVVMKDLEDYLHARHAPEANRVLAERNPGSADGLAGMTTADAEAYMRGLEPKRRADFESLAGAVDKMVQESRQLLVSYGLESQDTVDAWAKTYEHYVPLMREDMDGTPGTGQGFSVRGASSKARTGSERKVVDILANIAMQRERAIVRGEKNRVANAMIGMAETFPNADLWKVDEPPTERVVNPRSGLVETRIDPLYKSRDNVITARVPTADGVKERVLVLDPANPRAVRMAQAIKNLDMDQLGKVLGASAKVTRYLASVNTQYNPVFGIVNLVRDAQGALFNLSTTPIAGKQAAVAANLLSALKGIYTDSRRVRAGGAGNSEWSREWEEFQRVGGQTGYRDMFRTSSDRADAIADELKRAAKGDPLKAGRAVFDWLSDYNLAMENAVRLSAYRVAKQSGMSSERAASLAKNLTVNFNRKGQVAQQAGALYAFFNASAQGTARMAQTLAGPAGRRILVGGLTLGVVQALALAAAGFDDDEPPEFVRERSLIIPTGGGKYISIPMPLGLHVIPSTSRILTEFALTGFEDGATRVTDLVGLFADAFNPIGNAGISLQTVAPTVVDPFAALSENQDFAGRPIFREDFNKLAPTPGFTRARDTSTWWSDALSKGLNLLSGGSEFSPGVVSPTPDAIDYLIEQATGGVGREISKVVQTSSSVFTGEELPPYKVPLLGRFFGDTSGQASEANAFYRNVRRINLHEAEIKGRVEKRQSPSAYIAEHPDARLVRLANTAERRVRELRTAKRLAVERSAPAATVRQIETQITAQMKLLNDRARALREAA